MSVDETTRACLILFLCSFTLINCGTANSTENNSSIIREYVRKICKNEPTCHLVSSVPEDYRDLKVRNCMCDEDCSKYKDCCIDSPFSNSSPLAEIKNVRCVKGVREDVYMIAKCPENSKSSVTVKEYCEEENTDILAVDVLLSTPVTTSTKFTFKNLFCALCHGETTFTFWNLYITYELVPKPVETNLSETNSSTSVIPATTTTTTNTSTSTSTSTSFDADTVLKNLTINEEYYFKFTIDNDTYKLVINHDVPHDLKKSVRYCVANLFNECPSTWNNSDISSNCANYTAYTYTESKVYKNADCLACYNESSERICREKYDEKAKSKMSAGSTSGNWFEISIKDERIKKVDTRCADIPSTLIVFDMFCSKPKSAYSQNTTKTNESVVSPPVSCYPIRKDVNLPCLVNHIYSNDEIKFIDNQTIHVYSDGADYPIEEYSSNRTHTYVCGTVVYHTRFERFIEVLDEILTSVLIKISMMCLVLQLIMFQQLPELKNLSGKNLAAFCTTLLVAFMCFDFGPWLPSCKATAAVAHYAFLSCFTWMLVMSYDCWLSLYRATSQFRAAGGKHKFKFILYCIICWSLPLVVVGPSVFIELTDTFGCTFKPGYGVAKECFIFGKRAQYVFFFLPASLMFLGNIGFFTHTAYMIYHSQKSTVNPNTRNDFRLYTRLALLMGLTWTLGSIAQVTGSVVIGLTFSIMNMSQGMFIFFGFTFKKKTLRSLLEKHKDSRLLSTTLSSLVSGGDATAHTVTTDIKAQIQTDVASGQL